MTKAQVQGKSSTDEKDSSAAKAKKPVERSQESPLLPPHLLTKAPRHIKPPEVSSLQQMVGNRAVQRLIAKDQHDAADASTVIQRHTMWLAGMRLSGGTEDSMPIVTGMHYREGRREEEEGGE